MGDFVNQVTDSLGLTDSQAAVDATRRGYGEYGRLQGEALDYLKEADALPRQYREDAMTKLANIYGFGDDSAQTEFFAGLESDPFYKTMMDTLGAREDAFLRNQSATGDLRGGASVVGVGDIAQQTEQQAILQAYQNQLGGIQSLMGLPDYTSNIYGGMTDAAEIAGKGKIAVGQAKQDAEQAGFNNLVGLGKVAVGAGWI